MLPEPTKDRNAGGIKAGNSLVIGVTGGVGAGKSRILEILEKEYGAQVLYADKIASELEEPGHDGYRLLVEAFGTGILGEDGRLDREAFAQLIFKDPKILQQVNSMIHPLTWKVLRKKVEEFRAAAYRRAGEEFPALAVVEAALFDEKSRAFCDILWYVDVSEENRIRRLMENRGYTREKCLDIMRNQPRREDFVRMADEMIDNNETIEQVREQIAGILRKQQQK